MSFDLSCKEDVLIEGMQPEMVFASIIITGIFSQYGYPAILTSGIEGDHSVNSLHPVGYALDYRTRHLPDTIVQSVVQAIDAALTKEFDVVLHSTHVHIEFDPKGKDS